MTCIQAKVVETARCELEIEITTKLNSDTKDACMLKIKPSKRLSISVTVLSVNSVLKQSTAFVLFIFF